MKRIIIASNNKNKIAEFRAKLGDLDFEIVSQSEAGYDFEVEETGTTFEENSLLKAKALYEAAKEPVIADDSGLEVDFLNGEPGVYSKRFAGEDSTPEDRNKKILELLDGVEDSKRAARFRCVITYIDENGEVHVFEGVCNGKIGLKPTGNNGFGYDPIFMVDGKSLADISQEEKNKISHRGRALDKWVEYLKNN